jgi:hypothetical protein
MLAERVGFELNDSGGREAPATVGSDVGISSPA